MEEKFYATIYKKIKLTDNLYIFKRTGYAKNGEIDFFTENYPMTYNNSGKTITLSSLESTEVITSTDKYYYGYAVDFTTLSSDYPDIADEKELFQKYKEEMNKVLCFGYYNEEKNTFKLVDSNEEIIRDSVDDKIFDDYNFIFDSENDFRLSLPFKYIDRMIEKINKKEYKNLKEELIEFREVALQTAEGIDTVLGTDFMGIKEEKEEEDNRELDEIMDELNSLIGIENIKKEIDKLKKYLLFRDKVGDKLKLEKPNLHMIFTGNPGTGKTTVARIIGRIYNKMGYAKSTKFAEVSAKDLIAEYVGQTAVKTAKVIDENKNGVIFIDEAYVLASDSQKFAHEAIAEILKELEKNETFFIFAGYKDEMRTFIEMNPGLSSRVGYFLDYNDYSVDELMDIFDLKTNKIGFNVEGGLKEKVRKLAEKEKDTKNFGNGRFIEKLIFKIILEHSNNTSDIDDIEVLKTLTENDFSEEFNKINYKEKKKVLGF